jgi:hypothetical protein
MTAPDGAAAAPDLAEEEPPGPAGSTAVGTLGSPFLALVDGAGRTAPLGAGWALDWWVGADDRWHVPADERAVRQQLVGSAPVVETAMRIPSGDAVLRAWAVPGPGAATVVVEVENTSPVPVALALAVVPSGEEGGPQEVALDGTTVLVDGRPALELPKPANRVAASSDGAEALQAVVTAGEAGERLDGPVQAAPGRAAALAVVVPLPHRATMTFRLPLGGAPAAADPVPEADAVVRGWVAQTDRGVRIELPDERLLDAFAAVRRSLLVWAQASGDLAFAAAAELAAGLARLGMGDEALAVLAQVTERPGAARALSRRTRDPRARAAWVAAVERARDAVGDDALADRLGGAPRGTTPAGPRPGSTPAEVQAWLASASPTWGWSASGAAADPTLAAAFVGVVLDALVQEAHDGLVLLPAVPDSWRGQGIEVHDLPTRRGLLSFAVRWHGERPALLWDLQGGDGSTHLTMPGLDPSWSTTEARGETLLAAPA